MRRGHVRPADGNGAAARGRDRQRVHRPLDEEDLPLQGRGHEQRAVAVREVLGGRVQVLGLPLELPTNEPLDFPPVPERDHGLRAVVVRAEQEPPLGLPVEPPLLPPLPHAAVLAQGFVADLGEPLVVGDLLPPLLGPLARLLGRLRQRDVELAGEVEGGLERPGYPPDGAPHVNNVAAEAAREAVDVAVVVEVHRGVLVLVAGVDATALAADLRLAYHALQGHAFPQSIENTRRPITVWVDLHGTKPPGDLLPKVI